MSSTEQEPAAEPSTDLELVAKVDWLRGQLEQVQATAQRAVATRKVGPLDEWVNVLADYEQLAQTICRTEFVPKDFRGQPEKTTAAMMYGREVGLQPMTTLQNTHVIHGRVGMYAEQLRAMILAAGHEYVIDESNSDRCTISGRRKDSQRWSSFTYTMDQAKLAGLWTQNDQYKKRPTEMLLARASGIMAHAMFPDVIRGMGAVEEMEGAEGDQPDNAPTEPAAKAPAQVGRKPKAAAKALTSQPGSSLEQAGRTDPVIPEPSLPDLPGEAVASPESSAGAPGEGAATPVATPAEPTHQRCDQTAEHLPHTWDGFLDTDGPKMCDGNPGPVPGPDQCPHISNGEMCTWPSGHPGKRHSYDDPTQPISEGDGSPDDIAATGTDGDAGDQATAEAAPGRHCPDFDNQHAGHVWRSDDEGSWVEYYCPGVASVQPASSAPLDPSTVVPLSKAQTAMLQSRFKQLGFTDSEEDIEARLSTATRILGRPEGSEVTTFRAVDPGSGGMSKDEASRVIKAIAPCKDRNDIVEMLVRLGQSDG